MDNPVTPSSDPLLFLIGELTASLQFLGQKYLLPGAGLIGVIIIIYGGIKYITGGVKGGEDAKKTITAAIVGLIIVAISYLIIRTAVDITNSIPPPIN